MQSQAHIAVYHISVIVLVDTDSCLPHENFIPFNAVYLAVMLAGLDIYDIIDADLHPEWLCKT